MVNRHRRTSTAQMLKGGRSPYRPPFPTSKCRCRRRLCCRPSCRLNEDEAWDETVADDQDDIDKEDELDGLCRCLVVRRRFRPVGALLAHSRRSPPAPSAASAAPSAAACLASLGLVAAPARKAACTRAGAA